MNERDLQFALDHGIIDATQVTSTIKMIKRKELLEKHKNKIWRSKSGRWFTYVDVHGKRVQRSRRTKAELEDMIIMCIKENEDPTIDEVFEEWSRYKVECKKICESTYIRYHDVYNHFYGEFGKQHIGWLSPDDFREFLEDQVPKHDLTAKAFSNLKSITRGFLKYAKRNDYIDWSFDYMLSEIDISAREFARNVKEDYEEVYSDDEMELIMDYLMKHPDPMNYGLLLLFVTGIRVGELSTLKPENIGDGYINIRMTETHLIGDKAKVVIGVKDFPKSEAGWRTVVVPTDWKWLLDKIRLLNPWGEWCFISTDGRSAGKRIVNTSFEKRLRKINAELGIYQKSPHKIRKTYGTILLDENIDQNMIIQQMGHASIIMTERHYHRNRKSIDDKARILNSIGSLKAKNEKNAHSEMSPKMLIFQAK